MCGIGGFTSRKGIDTHSAYLLAKAFLYYASDRGKQSGGLYVDGKVAKRAIDPMAFANSDEVKELFAGDVVHTVMVHTRQPTSGGKDDEHAQPFHVGDVFTTHNGMITNDDAMREKFGLETPSGVDSELVTSYIHKHGIAKFSTFLESMTGGAAVSAVVGERLYLVRHGNPLAYQYLDLGKDGSFFGYASTSEILMCALRYVFLLGSHVKPSCLASDQVYRVKEKDLVTVGSCAKQTVITYPSRDEWDNDDAWMSRYRARSKGKNHIAITKPSDFERLELLKDAVAIANRIGLEVQNPGEYGFYWFNRESRVHKWQSYSGFKADCLAKASPNANNNRPGHWEDLGNGSKVWRYDDVAKNGTDAN